MGNPLICQKRSKMTKPNTMFLVCQKYREKFHEFELHALAEIYRDIGQRSGGLIDRESFNEFFKIIGLWGEKIFNKFTRGQEDFLTFEEFIGGLCYYFKCPKEDRVEHLFQLYDLHSCGGIEKQDFLQMLQNFPKEELKQILDDQVFLQEQDILQAYDKNTKWRSKKGSEDLLEQSLRIMRKQSHQSERVISDHRMMPSPSNCSINISHENLFPVASQTNRQGIPMKGYGVRLKLMINGQSIEITANLNLLIKKYVDNVYKLKSNVLTLADFNIFINRHPKLLHTLYSGFNHDIWGLDAESVPLYKSLQLDMSGELLKLKRDGINMKSVYCELYPNFLLQFKKKNDSRPTKILCMTGLSVQENSKPPHYSFEISHVDRVSYNAKTYICQDEVSFKKWTQSLQPYFNGEISKQYTIQQQIGEGRFSTVYKCQHKITKAEYALKIVDKLHLAEEEKQLISHETEIMQLLNHPCIVRLVSTIENRSHIYIVSELLQDGDLFDYVISKNYLDNGEAAFIMQQLIDALIYIHSIGIIHRDLKPENIMIIRGLRRVKQVKLIDFGFANYPMKINLKSDICGTPNYIAPEVLLNKDITFKADNFALGAIMYFLLSGYLPFDSPNPTEIIQNTLEGQYDLEDEFWQCVDDSAKDLMRSLLQPLPENRISLENALKHRWFQQTK